MHRLPESPRQLVGVPSQHRQEVHRHERKFCHRLGPELEFHLQIFRPKDESARQPATLDPQAVDPRSAMPDLGIGRDDAAAIAAFLLAAEGGG